jgi:thiosulfate reductase cytochrome b subunit
MSEPVSTAASAGSYLYARHTLPVRIMHWVNVLALVVLFMSGLAIFNAHPSLYWGKSSYTGVAPILEIAAQRDGSGQIIGVTRIFGREFNTTGFLGASTAADGTIARVAFPGWITIPSSYWLSKAREWHFFFAWVFVLNGIAYLLYSLFSRHLKRDLLPTGTDLRGIGQSIKDHVRFKHPKGEDAKRYNVLQKFAYLAVIFVLLPLIIVAGWAMSPWLNSIAPGWVDWLGGRQSARTIHFIVAWLLFAFVAIHVFEVLISGVWNHMRSMITGKYRIDVEKK